MAVDDTGQGTRGFVYVATGEAFVREAAEAARHLRAANPWARICLITDQARGECFWDDLVLVPSPSFDFRDKLELARCPYDRFVYLDADTFVAGELSELFELLCHFDVIGHQLFEGHDYHCPGVPDAFPEFNGGVSGFRRSEAVVRFFARWREIYLDYRARNTPEHYDYANASEQKGFRMALYESGLRHTVLAPEFNFIVQHVQFACAEVKILHGRPMSELQRIERVVNAKLGPRAWVPILDRCVAQRLTTPGWMSFAWQAAIQALRGIGRALLPPGLRAGLRRSHWMRRAFLRNDEDPAKGTEHRRKWGR